MVTRSPKIGQLKHSYQEGKPTAPVSVELTNGEPERAENRDMKLEQDLTLPASGEQDYVVSVAFSYSVSTGKCFFRLFWGEVTGVIGSNHAWIFSVVIQDIQAILSFCLQHYNR